MSFIAGSLKLVYFKGNRYNSNSDVLTKTWLKKEHNFMIQITESRSTVLKVKEAKLNGEREGD